MNTGWKSPHLAEPVHLAGPAHLIWTAPQSWNILHQIFNEEKLHHIQKELHAKLKILHQIYIFFFHQIRKILHETSKFLHQIRNILHQTNGTFELP